MSHRMAADNDINELHLARPPFLERTRDEPAFAQGTLADFRERLIRYDMDRRLLERTAEFARTTKAFDWRKLPKTLRVAIDSSPLEGAGRVEDTINLLGHAARKIVQCVAELLERPMERVAREAGIPALLEPSIKKALDNEWSDPEAKAEAINTLVEQLDSLETWLRTRLPDEMTKLALAAASVGLWSMLLLMAGRSSGGGRKLAFFAASLAPVMFCCHFLLPQRVEDGKAPGHFLMKHAERVRGDSIIVNYNMTRALCWFYKRSDIVDTVGKGELEYGYSYPEAKNRYMPVDELARAALDKSRAKPLFVFCRTKIYNKDIKPFMPDPKFVSMEHDFVIAEY